MKHVYYGVKKQKETVVYEREITDIGKMLSRFDKFGVVYQMKKEELNAIIIDLKEKSPKVGRYALRVIDREIDDKVIIHQSFSNQHTSEVGEVVAFKNLLGQEEVFAEIVDRIYEPIENVMYYYTNIPTEVLPLDEEDFESKRIELLNLANAEYLKHFVDIEDTLLDNTIGEDYRNQGEPKDEVKENNSVPKKGFKKLLNFILGKG